MKEEYGSNIPAHLLVPPVGPNQVKTRDSGIGSWNIDKSSPQFILKFMVNIRGSRFISYIFPQWNIFLLEFYSNWNLLQVLPFLFIFFLEGEGGGRIKKCFYDALLHLFSIFFILIISGSIIKINTRRITKPNHRNLKQKTIPVKISAAWQQ